ncbi:MAG: SMI1/KNR4 family protein [Opitutae bacterium]|nr:SMI1/KNR4 family protein [Opitutae bacterium]
MSDRYTKKKSRLPESYVSFIEASDGWEGDLGDYYGYVVIWDKAKIQEYWDSYEMVKYLPDYWFPFGSNGGGDMLCFNLKTKGDASFLIPFIPMCEQDAMEHCVSFELIATEIAQRSNADEAAKAEGDMG